MHCDGVIRHESWCTTQSAGAPGRVKNRRNIPAVNLAPSEGAKKEASAEASGKAFRARPGDLLTAEQEQLMIEHLPIVRLSPGASMSGCLNMCRLKTSTARER
jgi:hypothetical protein